MAENTRVGYHLRYHIIPGGDAERHAHSLADFCREHGIEEVVLFVAASEWNPGLLSATDETRWFNHLKKVKAILDDAGIRVSVNIWATTLHWDGGRSFPEDRRFKPMVSPCGQKSQACASFADPRWQEYITDLYARFAKLGVRVLWVEDDFRYHNHPPLTWGGGFEPGVLKRFADKLGRKVTREQVVRNILKPGRPHPWRALWMENWHELQLEVAERIAKAVTKTSRGRSTLGLMSSVPSTHSVEGRRWRELFDALTIDGKVAHRPSFAPYQDIPAKTEDYGIMTLDLQRSLRPSYCEVAPEVENWPFSRWRKSDTQTWAEMALALMYGSDALLMDLCPFSGNCPSEQLRPEVGQMLRRSDPAMRWIARRFAKSMQTHGVGLPWRQDAQMHVQTRGGESLDELNASPFGPGHFLLPYGIPVSANQQKVNAVFGNLAWAFSDEELRGLLGGGLLLDGAGAEILCRRGYARQIGVDVEAVVDGSRHPFSVEMTADPACGVRKGFYASLCEVSSLAIIHPRREAKEWTSVLTARHERVGSGLTIHTNDLGGCVATYAAVDPAGIPRSSQRQIILQKALCALGAGKFGSVFVTGGANLLPIHFASDARRYVVVLNGSPDAARPIVHGGPIRRPPRKAWVLAPLSRPRAVRFDMTGSKRKPTFVCPLDVPCFGYLVLEW